MSCNCNDEKGTKILVPEKVSKEIQSFLEKAEKEMDIDLKGCSYRCEWFTVCDPKCRRRMICWWQCTFEDGTIQKIIAPEDISNNIQSAIESLSSETNGVIDIKGCSYKCEWFTVCDPKCKRKLICWWQCT